MLENPVQVAFQANDIVYRPGDEALAMYLIVAGEVTVQPDSLSASHRRTGLRTVPLSPGGSDGKEKSAEEAAGRKGKGTGEQASLIAGIGAWTASDGEIFGAYEGSENFMYHRVDATWNLNHTRALRDWLQSTVVRVC